MQSPASPTRCVVMDTHPIFCECGCSSIPHAQAAPKNPLILPPARKHPVRSHIDTASADPYLPHPVPPAQQLGAGWPHPAPGRVLRQAQTEVTVLLGRLLAVPNLVSIGLVISYHFSHRGLSPLLQVFVLLLQFHLPPFLKKCLRSPLVTV